VWSKRRIKATDIGRRMTLENLLRRIPVIHTLDFTRSSVENSTIQTILKSSIRVRNLKLYDCTIQPEALCSVNTVLHHLSGNLEGLSIELQKVMQNTRKFRPRFMVNLRKLTLIGDVYLDRIPEGFDFDCHLLESLDVSRFNDRSYIHSDPRRYFLVSNLINKARGKLKTLYLPIYCDKTILNSVQQCGHLTTISLQLEYVAVVSHLPLIETLIIHCDSSADPPLNWLRPINLRVLVLHLRRPKEASVNFLKNIRAQNLTLISDNLCREMELYCSENVQRLTVRCHFLRLRHLSVTILRKAVMPNLKFLDVRYCFLGKGIPPKILDLLKKRFPSLTVRSDKFSGYQKKRELRNDVDCTLQESTDCSDTE